MSMLSIVVGDGGMLDRGVAVPDHHGASLVGLVRSGSVMGMMRVRGA